MTATETCPPMADRITKSLLGYGVIAGPIYVVSVAAQEGTRAGFDPTRHVASQLVNGDLGWIQIATFLVTGAMTIAAAVGIRRALGSGRFSTWVSGLIGGYGAGLVAADASAPTRPTDSRRELRRAWHSRPGTGWRTWPLRESGSSAWSPRASSSPAVRAWRRGRVGMVLPHYRRPVRGDLPRHGVRLAVRVAILLSPPRS